MEAEISAERDRLRAENAIRVHQLTARIEQARLYEARQKVEINRRDATISNLERRLSSIETEREGSENARRVLEATITQRIPEVEGRLSEARQLLAKRDAEMKALQADTGRTFRALDEAMQVNAQQRSEINRLKMSLASQGGRLHGSGVESEAALRSELETLRARSRDQALLITKLQSAQKGRFGVVGTAGAGAANDDTAKSGEEFPYVPINSSGSPEAAAEIKALTAKVTEQAAEIEDLKGQVGKIEETDTSKSRSRSARDPSTALEAKITAAQKEISARDGMISDLRRELAKANERIARQALYYTDEMRRLGAGRSGGDAAKADGAQAGRPSLPRNGAENGKATDQVKGQPGHVAEPALPIAVAGPEVVAAEAKIASERRNGERKPRPSLKERLAESGAETDQSDGVEPSTNAEREEPKHKLMDRIAALAKR